MSDSSDHKGTVRRNYDRNADLYVGSRRMQDGNLRKLVALLCEGERAPAGALLDVGCGSGPAVPLLSGQADCFQGDYVGVDLSAELIKRAVAEHGSAGTFVVGDAERLPFVDGTFSIVLSNSVLHWLNVSGRDRNSYIAMTEAYRVLAKGGLFVASISGAGTASRFLQARAEILNRLGKQDGNAGGYSHNPIGSMHLHEVVEFLSRAGFAVDHARMDYEAVLYDDPLEYQEDARAYGYDVFLASVRPERREDVWSAIGVEFRCIAGAPYLHDQYMIYTKARKL
jgi:ubiquinone/menaquinone biosynthesis C-methylase UbiE